MPHQSTGAAAPRQAVCKQCSAVFRPRGKNPGVYCTRACKAAWQRTQKPVDRDWLHEKYVVEGRSANEIGRIVGRDSKRVWQWLRDLGIPTRPRGRDSSNHFRVGGPNPFQGRKHSAETRKRMSDRAKAEGRVPYDPKVGSYMKGRKGPQVPSWKGGITPERQAFYSTPEWKAAAKEVWSRDDATCQRCGRRNKGSERFAFDVHHVVSFACVRLRADVNNLVLLCEACHYWVHSSENAARLFIKEDADAIA